MRLIRDLFGREGPLVEAAEFDSVPDPREIRIQFADGLEDADWCRLDVTWYKSGVDRFHYVDESDAN